MGTSWAKDKDGNYTHYVVNGVDMLAHGYTPDSFTLKERAKMLDKWSRPIYSLPREINQEEFVAERIKAQEELERSKNK